MIFLAPLAAIGVFGVAAAVGARLHRLAGWSFSSRSDLLLFSVGIGLATLGLAVFLLGVVHALYPAVLVALLAVLLLLCGRALVTGIAQTAGPAPRERGARAPFHRLVGVALALVLLATGLTALAPLTGSDAMQYHFTFPKLFLRWHAILPIDWDVNSFFLGTPQMLILLGLALGSDRIALALNAGVALIAVGAVGALAREFVPAPTARLVALVYAVTPLVYWQATSGYVDLWGVLYAVLALLAALRALRERTGGWLVLAGVCAGAAFTCKYTLVALVPALAVGLAALLARDHGIGASFRLVARFLLAAAVAGAWVPVRNLVWTGDPLFPFLTALRGDPHSRALAEGQLVVVPGGRFSLAPGDLLAMPVRMFLTGDYGDGHLFGPVVLSLVPLLALAARDPTRAHRLTLGLCAFFFSFIVATAGTARYLAPIYPLLLVLVLVAGARVEWSRVLRLTTRAVVGVHLAFGSGSLAVYCLSFLPVLAGLESDHAFLARRAPQYGVAMLVNETVPRGERVLVFSPFTYYLDVDFLVADLDRSFTIDVPRLASAERLRDRLRELGIRYVVTTGGYADSMARLFRDLEECCVDTVRRREVLTPGTRWSGPAAVHVAIFRVRDDDRR